MKQNINKTLLLKKLFFSTLYLSAFTFGGGYVIVSLMKTKFVDNLHWIDENEMLDLIAIAQSSPGAVAVNGAIVIGYKLCGVPGVIFSILGAIIPPFFVISYVPTTVLFARSSTLIMRPSVLCLPVLLTMVSTSTVSPLTALPASLEET